MYRSLSLSSFEGCVVFVSWKTVLLCLKSTLIWPVSLVLFSVPVGVTSVSSSNHCNGKVLLLCSHPSSKTQWEVLHWLGGTCSSLNCWWGVGQGPASLPTATSSRCPLLWRSIMLFLVNGMFLPAVQEAHGLEHTDITIHEKSYKSLFSKMPLAQSKLPVLRRQRGAVFMARGWLLCFLTRELMWVGFGSFPYKGKQTTWAAVRAPKIRRWSSVCVKMLVTAPASSRWGALSVSRSLKSILVRGRLWFLLLCLINNERTE